jgi:hypothetical protein
MRMLGRYEQGWGNDSVAATSTRTDFRDEDGLQASLLIAEPGERQEFTEAFDCDIPAGN